MTTAGSYQPLLADLPHGIANLAEVAHAPGVLVADGRQAQDVIAELLARPGVELVHLRNVGYGCYNFAVRRRR